MRLLPMLIQNSNLTPNPKIGPQTPLELAAVVSFRDDGLKRVSFEVS